MRNPKRIKRILKLVEKIWKKCPDYRLTQLIMNALAMNDDPYHIEDEVLEGKLEELYEKIKNSEGPIPWN
jgi:hypothetical protein